ncbi:hypothetical protein [Amycolatopsis sp. NPDC003676]
MSGTRSSDHLTVPEAWAAGPAGRYRNALAILMLLTLAAAAISVYLYTGGRWMAGTGAAWFTVLLAVFVYVGTDARLRQKPTGSAVTTTVTAQGRPATELSYSAVQFSGYLFILSWIAFGLFLFAVLAHGSDDPTVRNATIPFAVAGVLILTFPAVVALGWFRRGRILLTAEGIYQRGWTFESFLPWSAITSIQPYFLDGPEIWVAAGKNERQWQRKQFTRWWRQDRLPEDPVLQIPAKNLGVDATFAYHLLGYYYLHPASRTELGSTLAVDRARQANF